MQKLIIFIVSIGLVGINVIPTVKAKDVTNDEIRDAILSLVHSYSLLDNKLERHEHRERALGEIIKRALQSLQKGQKVYEPIKGIFSRLDERVSQIETMLIAQEEKYNVQSEKLTEAIETTFKWMKANSGCDPSSNSNEEQNDSKYSEIIKKLEKLSDNVEDLTKSAKGLHEETEKIVSSKLSSADEVISKMEDKLTHFYITGPATTAATSIAKNSEFEEKVTNYLQKISDNVVALKDNAKINAELSVADKTFIEGLSNDTLAAIEDMKIEVLTASDKALIKTGSRLKEAKEEIQTDVNEVLKVVTQSSDVAQNFYKDVNISTSALHDGLDVFNKFDKILLATSEYVLDTQRKVEYGTHQILVKVGDLIKKQNTDLNVTLQKRFDDIDQSIISNHIESLQNLSATMELEISHVWRQIEIMHSEISYSKDALNKLQDQTEMYVNGTMLTMDNISTKVAKVTSRTEEVDENLNYLLGRLSLVTQEFNQIKTGLGSALDQIRSSFKTVQEKIQDVGPGPHPIPDDGSKDKR